MHPKCDVNPKSWTIRRRINPKRIARNTLLAKPPQNQKISGNPAGLDYATQNGGIDFQRKAEIFLES
jgi:RecA/RadA recombinase